MAIIPEYELFIKNPFIASISYNEKWTISTNKKMPVDMFQLIYKNKISGAAFKDNTTLTTLHNIHSHIPNAANFAYYLDTRIDGFVILDIEPSCPEDIRNQLLTMDWIYGEKSMSGKGIHLVFPLPDSFYDYPDALKKTAFIHKDRIYEILLNHYVTFTAAPLPDELVTLRGTGQPFTEFFNSMASQQKETKKADLVIEIPQNIEGNILIQSYVNLLTKNIFGKEDDSEIPKGINYRGDELATLKNKNTVFQPYTKRLSDFRNVKTGNVDHSRFECSVIGYCNHMINRLRNTKELLSEYDRINPQPLSQNDQIAIWRQLTDCEKAWIMYKTAEYFLIPREKHKETRCGLPWLMYIAQYILSIEIAEKNDNKKARLQAKDEKTEQQHAN